MLLSEEEKRLLSSAEEVGKEYKKLEKQDFPEIVIVNKEELPKYEGSNIIIPIVDEISDSKTIKEVKTEIRRGLVVGCVSKEQGDLANNEEFGIQYIIEEEANRVKEEKKKWKIRSKIVRKAEAISRLFSILGLLTLGLPYISLAFSLIGIISGLVRKKKDRELIAESKGNYEGCEKLYLGTIMGVVGLGLKIIFILI